jgi:hypothetical protein
VQQLIRDLALTEPTVRLVLDDDGSDEELDGPAATEACRDRFSPIGDGSR